MSKKTTEASKEAKEIWQSGKDAKEAASKMKAEKLMKDPLLAYQGRGDFSGVRPPAQSTPVKKKEGTMGAPVTKVSKDLFKGGKRKRRRKRGGKDNMCSNYYYKKYGNTEQQSNFERRDDVTPETADKYCKVMNTSKPACWEYSGKCVKVDDLGQAIAPIFSASEGGRRKTKKKRKTRKRGRKRKCCKCKRCTKKCPCKRKSKCLKRCKCMKRKTKRKYKKRNQRGCNRKK